MYAAVGWVLRDHPLALSLFGNAGLLAPPITVCVLVLRRRSRWVGCQRLFWDTVGISVALWCIGHLGWAFDEIVRGRQSWLQWHTLFSLCGEIGPLIALLARPHRGVRSSDVGTVGLALASYGLFAVFLYSYFVLVPSLVPGTTNSVPRLFELVQVNRTLLFVAMTASMLAARGTPWHRAYVYFALATGLGFFLRIVTSFAIVAGDYQVGSVYDLAWIAPFLCYAGAALTAPDSPADSAGLEAPFPPLHAAVSAIPVFLIPLAGYGALYVWPLGGPADSFRALLTAVMTVGGLSILTIRLAAQGGQLHRADARMRLLAAATDQTAEMILITRANGEFVHANDAFVRALGYPRDALLHMSVRDLLDGAIPTFEEQVSTQVKQRGNWRGTLVRRRHDGTTFPTACTVVGLKNSAGAITHFVGVERDITEELKLRDQLVHSERLSAMGELVAGVAHEINNPLQAIVGSVELMMHDQPAGTSSPDLETVRREAARAGQIVRNLLSFVRRSASDRVPVDLNEIVRSTAGLREYHLRQCNIALVTTVHPTALPVLVNPEEIRQIVLNLILNAEQAMLSAGGGTTIALRCFPEGQQQIVEVTDDGPGIGAGMSRRIFEPFFTTKDVGEGTGLGLSISHGIASAHGGSLELCATGPGACFRLLLPAYAGSAPPLSGDTTPPAMSPAAPLASEPESVSSGARRLALVVDDEMAIRKLLSRLLERRGFEVIEAETGAAALAAAKGAALSIVLCDVRMPGMSGTELYRELAARSPRLSRAFVFITGDRATVEIESAPVLAKPFAAAELDAVLAQVGLRAVVA